MKIPPKQQFLLKSYIVSGIRGSVDEIALLRTIKWSKNRIETPKLPPSLRQYGYGFNSAVLFLYIMGYLISVELLPVLQH